MAAIGLQLAVSWMQIFMKKSELPQRERIVKICGGLIMGISAYLMVYFIIFQDGCEDLIRFWVCANLVISIAFSAVRMLYILIREGKEGVRKAINKRASPHSNSHLNQSSIEHVHETFKLRDDFYSIAFYSYLLM